MTPPPKPPLTEFAMLLWLALACMAGLAISAFITGCTAGMGAHWIPTGLKWNYRHTPLYVQWDRQEFGVQSDSVEMAMDQFPCDMYTEAPPDVVPHVTIDVWQGQETCADEFKWRDGALGYALPCRERGACEIYLDGSALGRSTTDVFLIVAHELGHCASLGHNESLGFYASIMHPNVVAFGSNLKQGKPLPMFTDEEEAMLEARYCEGDR